MCACSIYLSLVSFCLPHPYPPTFPVRTPPFAHVKIPALTCFCYLYVQYRRCHMCRQGDCGLSERTAAFRTQHSVQLRRYVLLFSTRVLYLHALCCVILYCIVLFRSPQLNINHTTHAKPNRFECAFPSTGVSYSYQASAAWMNYRKITISYFIP